MNRIINYMRGIVYCAIAIVAFCGTMAGTISIARRFGKC